MRVYHILVWGSALSSAVLLLWTNSWGAHTKRGWCWANSWQATVEFYVVWAVAIFLFAVLVWFLANNALNKGVRAPP